MELLKKYNELMARLTQGDHSVIAEIHKIQDDVLKLKADLRSGATAVKAAVEALTDDSAEPEKLAEDEEEAEEAPKKKRTKKDA